MAFQQAAAVVFCIFLWWVHVLCLPAIDTRSRGRPSDTVGGERNSNMFLSRNPWESQCLSMFPQISRRMHESSRDHTTCQLAHHLCDLLILHLLPWYVRSIFGVPFICPFACIASKRAASDSTLKALSRIHWQTRVGPGRCGGVCGLEQTRYIHSWTGLNA